MVVQPLGEGEQPAPELVALARRKPGQLSYSSFAVTAIGSAPHLAGVAVEKATGGPGSCTSPTSGGSPGDRRHRSPAMTQLSLMNGMLEASVADGAVGQAEACWACPRRAACAGCWPTCRPSRSRHREGLRVRHLASALLACRPPRHQPCIAREDQSAERDARSSRSPEVKRAPGRTRQGVPRCYTMTPAEFAHLLRAPSARIGRPIVAAGGKMKID